MEKYKYKALSLNGERIEGIYEADSKVEVLNMLSSNEYYPLMIEVINQGKEINLGKRKTRVKTKDIAIFCRQLATLIESGVTISGAVELLSKQLPNKRLRYILDKINDEIRKGESLSSSMDKQKDVFPSLLIRMIEIGEISGTLDTMLNRMAKYYEKENKINGKIKTAFIYPSILSFVTFFVITFILTFVMPMFIEMFKASDVELPLVTRITLGIGNGLREHGFLLIIILLAIIFSIKYYLKKTDKGIMTHSYYKLKKSPFKRLNQKIVVSKFTRSLATVLGAGVTLINGIDVVATVLENRYAEKQLKVVKEKILRGDGLSKPIEEAEIFPLMLSSMIKIGEESGALDEILNKTADFYDEELDRAIDNFTQILEPLMLIIMGVVVGFLIISVITPMFQMFNAI